MSPITLGILAASGAATVDFELISTVFGTGSSNVISFTSLPQTYKHLQIRFSSNGNYLNATNPLMRFNGDTGNNYYRHSMESGGSGTPGAGGTIDSNIIIGRVSNATYSTQPGASIVDILEYTSTFKNKTVKGLGGHISDGEKYLRLFSGVWYNTNAISTITISTLDGSNWPASGRFSLYGFKG